MTVAPQIKASEQLLELLAADRHRLALDVARKDKPIAAFEPLAPQAQAVALPVNNFYPVAPLIAEHPQRGLEDISLQGLLHDLLLYADLGKDVTHVLRKHIHEFVEERFVEAERAAVTHGAAQDAAQNVVAVGVAGLDAVGNRKAQRADVVGDDAEGDVNLDLLRPGSAAVPAASL